MGQWIKVDRDFIEADVIRWEEAVFAEPGRRSRRPTKIGTRRVAAEVTKGPDEERWVALLVRQCEVLTETVIGQLVEKFREGKTLRRSLETIVRGAPERRLWTDESARDAVLASTPPGRRAERSGRPAGAGTRKKRKSGRQRKRTRR